MAASAAVLDRLVATYQGALIRLTDSSRVLAGDAWAATSSPASFAARITPAAEAVRAESASLTSAFFDSYMQLADGGPAVPADLDAILARVRGGASIAEVYATAGDAVEAAYLIDEDVMLASAQANSDAAIRHDVQRFTRRPNPGACSFCQQASQQVYGKADLLPLHIKCHCVTVPAV